MMKFSQSRDVFKYGKMETQCEEIMLKTEKTVTRGKKICCLMA